MLLPSLHKYSDAGLVVLRLVIGVIFIYHGMQKWQNPDPNAIMMILKFAEPIGGIALILGVFTQLAALGLSIIMIGAIYMKATGFGADSADFLGTFASGGKWEFDLMILAGSISLFLMGAGKLSIDDKVGHKLPAV